ncbi:phosphate-starvation-inducible PsiE family protein [Thiomicrorhabdus sp. ZW0627]|uniref:phosphate-starvation-inducible protein PsiE n=1 Tax=Thiomicrorhabdus sp. ZW0627 TaxID=3039774 RepID=UPI0024371EAC|nr:phosphate-starvation-inducible PsiE family protein [Thiomicrorhabdus sp. ZW0627]MDG6774423.1 phosphate-starvation-inducible PsiE family protein [Thiomicrorhabdus sp. ZW0627]
MSTETTDTSLNTTPARTPNKAESLLGKMIHFFEFVGLTVIAIATIYAGGQEVMHMINNAKVTLGDLLLLFLYLEVLAMIAIYLDSGKLPIRFPLYIAIVALARYLILELKGLSEWEMIAIGVTITLITIATLILRYGHIKYPYGNTNTAAQRRPKD